MRPSNQPSTLLRLMPGHRQQPPRPSCCRLPTEMETRCHPLRPCRRRPSLRVCRSPCGRQRRELRSSRWTRWCWCRPKPSAPRRPSVLHHQPSIMRSYAGWSRSSRDWSGAQPRNWSSCVLRIWRCTHASPLSSALLRRRHRPRSHRRPRTVRRGSVSRRRAAPKAASSIGSRSPRKRSASRSMRTPRSGGPSSRRAHAYADGQLAMWRRDVLRVRHPGSPPVH